jgi:hypothetical protein
VSISVVYIHWPPFLSAGLAAAPPQPAFMPVPPASTADAPSASFAAFSSALAAPLVDTSDASSL